jgi:hypothetical protein
MLGGDLLQKLDDLALRDRFDVMIAPVLCGALQMPKGIGHLLGAQQPASPLVSG